MGKLQGGEWEFPGREQSKVREVSVHHFRGAWEQSGMLGAVAVSSAWSGQDPMDEAT